MNGEREISLREKSNLAEREAARQVVLAHGWNSTSYQIINPGIRRWFAAEKDAVVGFVARNKVRVVAGAPVCAAEDLREVAAEFERDARAAGERVCYFCAERRLESIYDDSPDYAKILIGAQPVWKPENWAEIVKRHKSLRAQVNRARNKKVLISEWTSGRARNHPALEECLRGWLGAKGLPPLHFLVEPDTLARLEDRRVFVAELEKAVVGFVILSPVARRNGWLFEQFIHCPDAPNGTVELLIDRAMRQLAEDGYEYATLGLAPLSSRAPQIEYKNPFWMRLLLKWMTAHGRRFYNFDGLDAFKAKLQPEHWEQIFAVSNERHLSPRTLYAIVSAFSGGAPFKLVFGGLWRALATEIEWMRKKVRNKKVRTEK